MVAEDNHLYFAYKSPLGTGYVTAHCPAHCTRGSCLKTGQHTIFVIIRKIKRIIHVCWIPSLFIEDFTDSMEEYFHF